MDLKTFLAAAYNVHESKHGREIIYVGHDPCNRWSAFFKGKERDLGLIDSLAQAQAAAHRHFDSGKKCTVELNWKLLPGTEVKDLTK